MGEFARMLAKLLATGVGIGSLTFYIAAFFFPEVHRRHDFFWSGVGLFYALALWICAGRFTGALLISQVASVALVVWLGWQTLQLRRAKTPLLLQTPATAEAWRSFRQEMAELLDSLVNLTPLSRWLPSLSDRLSADTGASAEGTIRAASVRKVGYEFVDDIDIQEPLPRPSQPRTIPNSLEKPKASQPSEPASPAPANQPAPAQRRSSGVRKPTGVVQIGIILKDWVVDVAKSMRRSKPSRPVIEIPPREPKSASSQSAGTQRPVKQPAKPGPSRDSANQSADQEANWSSVKDRPDEDQIGPPTEASQTDPTEIDLEETDPPSPQ